MSVDNCPTCPDCGDDLTHESRIDFSDKFPRPENTNWFCPECEKWFDIPEGDSEGEERDTETEAEKEERMKAWHDGDKD